MSGDADLLRASRSRERGQTLFYRALAGEAERSGDMASAERLNELLADEQHHVSRLTARLIEVGEAPGDEVDQPPHPPLAGWEGVARAREEAEVTWYEDALTRAADDAVRDLMQEILESERHHRDRLGGKWMPAAPGGQQEPE